MLKINLLPSDIIELIYEYDGRYKEKKNKSVRQLNYLFKSLIIHDMTATHECPIKDIDNNQINNSYQFYMFYKNKTGCNCVEPCCYRFTYWNEEEYSCRCCKLTTSCYGDVNYIYHIDRNRTKLHVSLKYNGFCSKIVKPKTMITRNIT